MTTGTDNRIALPPANYLVEQIIKGRSHLYKVTHDNGQNDTYGGVTGVLGVIAKPALIPWATNQGIASVIASMIHGLNAGEIKQSASEIAEAIKAAKKSKKFPESMEAFLKKRFTKQAGHFLALAKFPMKPKLIAEMMDRAINAPDEVKDQAADLGTQAHAYFEAYCKGEAPPIEKLPAAVRPAIERFLKWIANSGLSIVAGDTKVASLKHKFGGALDGIFCVTDELKLPKWLNLHEGDFVLGDYKTSNGVYDEYALQVGAYDQAFVETYGIECRAGVIVRFGKDQQKDEAGKLLPLDFEQKWLLNPKESFRAFVLAKELQARLKVPHFFEDADA